MTQEAIKKGGPAWDHLKYLATETAKLAQNLPDRAAIRVTVRVTIKEKHH